MSVAEASRSSEQPRGFRLVAWVKARFSRLWSIAKQTYEAGERDHIDLVAASLAFYAILGVSPALLLLVTIVGMVATPDDVAVAVRFLSDVVPQQGQRLIAASLEDFVGRPAASLSLRFIIALLALMWSASTAMNVLVRSVNLAYDIPAHGFFKRRMLAVGMTLAAMCGVLIVVPAITLLSPVLTWLRVGFLLAMLRWPLFALLFFGVLWVTFRLAPADPAFRSFRIALPGAALAAGLWTMSSILYSLYVRYAGNLASTYGALEGVIALAVWFLVSSASVLYGAELNAERARAQGPSGRFRPEH